MATYVITGGTATNPLTPTNIANTVGQVIYGNLYQLNSPGAVLQFGDGVTPTYIDDSGWHLLIWYNCRIDIKPFVTWVSGRSQNNSNVRAARYIMGYGTKINFASSLDITLNWYGIEFAWDSGNPSTNSLTLLQNLNANSHLDFKITNVFGSTGAKLLYTTSNILYSSIDAHNTIIRVDYSGTQFDKLVLNGRDSTDELATQLYGNTTSLVVNGYAPLGVTAKVGSIYGGYTNTALKNFYLNNPVIDPNTLLFYGANFYIHINIDMNFNIDQTGCNIGVFAGALPLQLESTYNFRVNDIWYGKHSAQVDAYELPENVWDNRTTNFKVRKYGFVFNEYTELVPITGAYNKTMFMKAKDNVTMLETVALNVTGVVLQPSADVNYVWELDCGGNTLDDTYHHIQAVLVNSGTLGGINTFELNDFLLRDGAKFKTVQIRPNEGVKLINYGVGKVSSFQKNDGTLYVPPVTVTFSLSGLQPNSEVRIYRTSDMVELAGVENSGISFGYNYTWSADIPIIVTIFSVTYDPIRFETTLTSSDTTIPIQQTFDRNYNNPV